MSILMGLNNNGQAITLSKALYQKGVSDGASLKALMDKEKGITLLRKPFLLALTLFGFTIG
jgi:hypothetical protein